MFITSDDESIDSKYTVELLIVHVLNYAYNKSVAFLHAQFGACAVWGHSSIFTISLFLA